MYVTVFNFQFPCHLVSHIPSLRIDLVSGVLSCSQIMVWLPVLGILNMCTDVNACDCT